MLQNSKLSGLVLVDFKNHLRGPLDLPAFLRAVSGLEGLKISRVSYRNNLSVMIVSLLHMSTTFPSIITESVKGQLL